MHLLHTWLDEHQMVVGADYAVSGFHWNAACNGTNKHEDSTDTSSSEKSEESDDDDDASAVEARKLSLVLESRQEH